MFMSLKMLATLSAVVGVLVAAFAGSAIARYAGFGAQSWLMLAFAFGILLLGQSPVLRLRQQVLDLQRQISSSDGDA
jgi:hypothetical protein